MAVELLDILRKGVYGGRVFCPISEAVFIELLKQGDMETRPATVALIDELSLGVTLIEQGRRIATEIAHFLYSNTGHTNLHPLKHVVWSKLSCALGILHPIRTIFDAKTEHTIQRTFFDHMWRLQACP